MNTEKKLGNVEISREFEVQVSSTPHGFAGNNGPTGGVHDFFILKFRIRHWAYLSGSGWIYQPGEDNDVTMSEPELDYLISQLQLAKQRSGREFLLHSDGDFHD
jgi:hypothetical protein